MTTTIMAQEARETPTRIAEQLQQNADICEKLGASIRNFSPSFVYMVGRGSSDHAGVFGKYLIEIETGLPVVASAPSIASVYQKSLQLSNALVIVISQSGRSPDILAQCQMAKAAGALCVALVNDTDSPLAEMVDFAIPLHAGKENAVAATKSFLTTLSALLQLVAHWQQDQLLKQALTKLPEHMQQAVNAPSQLNLAFAKHLKHCVVLGRGFGYAVGREIALKLKEVCSIHAEAFSSAEFLHGPFTLVEQQLAIVDISIFDESYPSHQEQVNEVKRRGAQLCHLAQTSDDIHPRLAALTALQRFYLDIEQIANDLGFDPDSPAGLNKVTKTV